MMFSARMRRRIAIRDLRREVTQASLVWGAARGDFHVLAERGGTPDAWTHDGPIGRALSEMDMCAARYLELLKRLQTLEAQR